MKPLSVLVLLLAPVLTGCLTLSQPRDCSEVYLYDGIPSGVYTIYPVGSTSGVEVHCDMETDRGGWTVMQRRMDGSVNFYRPWEHYKAGFGSAAGEYWLGLENIHHLTRACRYELLVDMEDFEGNKAFARYSSFSVGAESEGYVLHVSGFTDGGAGNSLKIHDGQKFSTFDKDQDSSNKHCAKEFRAAFWFNNCFLTNANGVYLWGADGRSDAVGVSWYHWKGYYYSLKTFSMKIRPVM